MHNLTCKLYILIKVLIYKSPFNLKNIKTIKIGCMLIFFRIPTYLTIHIILYFIFIYV